MLSIQQKTSIRRAHSSCQSFHFFPLIHTHFSLCLVYQVAIFHHFKHNIRYIQSKTLVQFTSSTSSSGFPKRARTRPKRCFIPMDSFSLLTFLFSKRFTCAAPLPPDPSRGSRTGSGSIPDSFPRSFSEKIRRFPQGHPCGNGSSALLFPPHFQRGGCILLAPNIFVLKKV